MAEDRAPFEKKLDVLENNQTLLWLTRLMVMVGPVLLLSAILGLFPPGFLGLHVAIVGFILGVAQNRTNWKAKRRSRSVRASAEGVRVDGQLVVARKDVADGFFQPRWSREEGGFKSSVRLVDKWRRVAFETEVSDENQALEILWTLGLDPTSKRAEFRGSPPMFATLGRNLLFIFGSFVFFGLLSTLFAMLEFHFFGIFPLMFPVVFLTGLIPSKIAVGMDGILLRWLWTKQFIPMSKVKRLVPEEDRMIRIDLVDGTDKVVYTSMRRRSGWQGNFGQRYSAMHRDAVLARMKEAWELFRQRGPAADMAALVGRGTRTHEEWFDALGKMAGADAGYRDAVVREDDLWRVVEDPAAPEDARAGATMVLRSKLDDAGKQRLRVAAEATASPKLRVVLETAAEDAALEDAMTDLAEEKKTSVPRS